MFSTSFDPARRTSQSGPGEPHRPPLAPQPAGRRPAADMVNRSERLELTRNFCVDGTLFALRSRVDANRGCRGLYGRVSEGLSPVSPRVVHKANEKSRQLAAQAAWC